MRNKSVLYQSIRFCLKAAIGFSLLVTPEKAWAGLQITSPTDGTVVTAGASVTVVVTVDSMSHYSAVQVVGENVGFSQAQTSFLINLP